MDSKKYIVYEHKNISNGKVYIGITSTSLERRCSKDGSGYKNNLLFNRAIQKYGWDNFTHTILFEGLSLNDAARIERKLISEKQSNNPEYGYNISSGGEGGNAGCKASEKLKALKRERMSGSNNPMYGRRGRDNPNFGKKRTEETKKKIGDVHRGKVVSKESRARLSETLIARGKWAGSSNPNFGNTGGKAYNARAVRCIETGEVYECIKFAAKDKGTYIPGISACCKGKAKTSGGFTWEYV